MLNIAYSLSWYSKETEEILGEENLELTSDEVRQWFNLNSDDFTCDCYKVTENQVALLQDRTSHDINLESFDYFIDAYN